MFNKKIAASLTIAGLLAANAAFALPEFTSDAPKTSVDTCIAVIAHNADYADAKSVRHDVVTEERRISGHRISIRTIVYGEGDAVFREYASSCAIDGKEDIKRFRIRRAGA